MLQFLAGGTLVRRVVDAAMTPYARLRVRRLDTRSAAIDQQAVLLDLVRKARHTRFGRDHDFGAIRSVADYQQRVPLRDYEGFWNAYWKSSFPVLRDVTWPGVIPYFALSSGTTSGSTKYIPVSTAMVRSNQRAGMTMVSYYLAAFPRSSLFSGRLFFLGGSSDLRVLSEQPHVLGGDLSGIATREVAPWLRPYTYPPPDLALLNDWEQKVQLLAERSVSEPITWLSGVPSWLLVLFERLRQVTGRQRIADIWPMLRVVFHGGTRFDPYRQLFREIIGSDDVQFVEVYPASEGFIATGDPRHGLLRLLTDNGLFFEFVPVEDLGTDRPARHTVANLEPGVQYAIAMTTCAGLWSYLVGDTVCFEKREPPMLRFTGRTRYFLSAFGEHLISEEVEKAIAAAATATGSAVVEFHVGPAFPEHAGEVGRHRYLVEFAGQPANPAGFAQELDAALGRLNEDYAAHRQGDLTLRLPEIIVVPRGGFAEWLRSHGKLGGQHKVPRMDNSGKMTEELTRFFARSV